MHRDTVRLLLQFMESRTGVQLGVLSLLAFLNHRERDSLSLAVRSRRCLFVLHFAVVIRFRQLREGL
jgi:hypothetical protein